MKLPVIKKTAQIAIPAALPSPKLSFALSMAIERTDIPHADIGVPSSYPQSVQKEAAQLLALIEPYEAKVSEAALRFWLAPIAGSVNNSPAPEQFEGWWPGFWLAVRDIEMGAFTEQTQAQALRKFTFWPSPAEIFKVVSGPAYRIRSHIQTLRRIIEAPTSPRGS